MLSSGSCVGACAEAIYSCVFSPAESLLRAAEPLECILARKARKHPILRETFN